MKNVLRATAFALSLVAANVGFASENTGTLQQTSSHVQEYLNQLSDVKCTERVTQEKFTPKGKVEDRQQSTFDYFVLMTGGSEDLLLDESRLEIKKGEQKKHLPMLITNGFSTLFLIFHPYYRESFRFSVPTESTPSSGSYRVDFEHVHGTRTPVALAVRGKEYPLDIAGSAWIDRATGSVLRMEAHLSNSMEDVGLKQLTVDVDYGPVKLPDLESKVYFPVRARVEVESLKQHWVNLHEFTDYKRFSVTTDQTVAQK